MTKQPVPVGYHTVQPYLSVAGAEKAIEFYTKAFGARQRLCMKDKQGRVVHAEIVIGDSCVMLADEHPEIGSRSPKHYGGSPVSLLLYVEDCDATYQQALAAGGTSVREPADQPPRRPHGLELRIRLGISGSSAPTSRMYPKKSWRRCIKVSSR